MHKLEQRIAKLEQVMPTTEPVTHLFIVPLGSPDSIQTIRRHGETWHRLENETAEEFQQRVANDTPMYGKGVAVFTSA